MRRRPPQRSVLRRQGEPRAAVRARPGIRMHLLRPSAPVHGAPVRAVRFLREARMATRSPSRPGSRATTPTASRCSARCGTARPGRCWRPGHRRRTAGAETGGGSPSPSRPAPSSGGCTEHGKARGVTGDGPGRPPPTGARGAGFAEISRGCVGAAECNVHGKLEPFQYVGRLADGAVNLMGPDRGGAVPARRGHRGRRGRGVPHRPPRAAAARRPLRRPGPAARRWRTQRVHLFFDEESLECVASCDVIAVAIDLHRRVRSSSRSRGASGGRRDCSSSWDR